MSYYRVFLLYLHEQHQKFEKYYNEHRNEAEFIEELRKLNYDGADDTEGQNVTNGQRDFTGLYSKSYIQNLYSLRYMYAYAYEYREMFRRLLREQELPQVINVLSVGCGTGVDYWALREALVSDNNKERDSVVYYTGLDTVDWIDQWGNGYLNMLKGSVRYITGDAATYFQNAEKIPHNVIVFPKSISEFPDRTFTTICDKLRSMEFKFSSNGREYDIQKVHFMISLRTDGNREVDPDELRDKIRSDKLIEAMEDNDFELCDQAAAEVRFADGDNLDERISDVDPDFFYPSDIYDFMDELNNNRHSKLPIMKTRFICNRILTFQRRQEA